MHPAEILPVYAAPGFGEAIELTRQPARVEINGQELKGEAVVIHHFLPSPGIRCYVTIPDAPLMGRRTEISDHVDLDDLRVRVPSRLTRIIGRAGHPRYSLTMVPEPGGICAGDAEARTICRLVFHVLNFHGFDGDRWVVHRNGTEQTGLSGEDMVVPGWNVVLQQLPGTEEAIKALDATGGYAITHVGEIRREDSSPFTGKDATALLEALHYYLSFARGLWSPPILHIGFDSAGERVWQRWDGHVATSWTYASSWYGGGCPGLLGQVFARFLAKWGEPTWREPLRDAIYWYLASNSGRMSDNSIILTQAALELLSWVYAVKERKLISPRGFRNAWASDKLRLLLVSLGIPTPIPDETPKLAELAADAKWLDGPQAFTAIRNSIIHPDPGTLSASHDAIVEARQLGLWYLEVALLKLFGHTGKYGNRLKRGRVGEVEDLPNG